MIRLNFLPSWVGQSLHQVGVTLDYEPLQFTHVSNEYNRHRDLVLHDCPKSKPRHMDHIYRKQHQYLTNFRVMYLVTVGQCPRCGEVFYDVLSCDPDEVCNHANK